MCNCMAILWILGVLKYLVMVDVLKNTKEQLSYCLET